MAAPGVEAMRTSETANDTPEIRRNRTRAADAARRGSAVGLIPTPSAGGGGGLIGGVGGRWQGVAVIDGWEWLAVFAAAVAAGGINALVGSGTLVTFSTLVTLGVPPLTANVSNTVGLVAGSVAGSWGYRRELAEQPQRIKRYVPASLLGGLSGAVLLLVLPEAAFEAIVPALVGLGVLLVAIQPWVARKLSIPHNTHIVGGVTTWALVYLVGIYGGYFGAAQGVLLIAILGAFVDADLQRVNGLKNVLAAVVNAVAAVLFIVVADVDWGIALVMTVGAALGGFFGAHYGRRLPDLALRLFIIAVGTVAVVVLVRA